MGGPRDPVTEGRLRTLEAQQKAASRKQAAMEAELANQSAKFAKTVDVLQDNNEAIIYLQKYLIHFLLETIEQGMMVSSAVTKFAGFLKLPPSSNSINPFLDFAFTAVSVLYPAVRLMKLLDNVSKAADVAIAISTATETAAPRIAVVVKAVPKIGEVADVLKKANDTRMKALASMKSDPSSEAVTELNKLDALKAPIKDLIETANRAAAIFDKVADVISAEFKKRVVTPETPRKESILDITKKVLTPPNFPTTAELDQLETTYLWEMVKSFCKKNVIFVKSDMPSIVATAVEGLNGTQVDALVDLFGVTVPRGQYCMIPVFFSGFNYLDFIGIQSITKHLELRAG